MLENSDNIEEGLNFGDVRDLVLGISFGGEIIDHTMDGLSKVAEYISNSTEIILCRVKDSLNAHSLLGIPLLTGLF